MRSMLSTLGYLFHALAGAALAAGCGSLALGPDDSPPRMDPLPVQQARAYPETVTGRFVSLADFESSPLTKARGADQARDFAILDAKEGDRAGYVVTTTRTGSGALEVVLSQGATLEYHLPDVHNFSDYTLLSLALHSPAIRDDLRVLISTDRAGWQSLPLLLKVGWNTVLIDLQRLKAWPEFESRGVRSIRLSFAAADRPVQFHLDDIMLIDNRRELPAPTGCKLTKNGLDYTLQLPNRQPITISQCDDGLWRAGTDQAGVALGGQVNPPAGGVEPTLPHAGGGPESEKIAPMGTHRVGDVQILESNPIRLRLANTWYFPAEAGQWESLSIRQIRWEYTFYNDGRWITDLTFNNAGGPPVSDLALTAPAPAAWSDGQVAQRRSFALSGSAGRWRYLTAPDGERKSDFERNFVKPARIQVRMGSIERADDDGRAGGFDPGVGCYRLRAEKGHCRFALEPVDGSLVAPVIWVQGRWSQVWASMEGQSLKEITLLPDGSALVKIPGVLTRVVWVELTGSQTPASGR